MRICVTGCGTSVGKTLTSAVLAAALEGDYWKPIQCGDLSCDDPTRVSHLTDPKTCCVFPPAYSLTTPCSPHHAAFRESIWIDPDEIVIPETDRPLIIETAGGLLTPINPKQTMLDLFEPWEGVWVITSKHYLGSINHTLLTIKALNERELSIAGIVFYGSLLSESEEVILGQSDLPFLGRIVPQDIYTKAHIQEVAHQWQKTCKHHIFGTPTASTMKEPLHSKS